MRNNYIDLNEQRIENLLVLGDVIDEFDKFDKDLLEIISSNDCETTLSKIIDIAKGKKCLFAKKEKKLCQNNKYLIYIFNKYGNLEMFLWENYYKDRINTYNGLKTFVEYLKKHKEDLDAIISVLKKIKNLGFQKIIFDENFDFTKETHVICKKLQDNLEIVYLDNLEAIPNYNLQLVKYRTKDSNYKITLALPENKIMPNHPYNAIYLNSLIFDPKRLPETLYRTDTFNKILELTPTVSKENKIIKDAIDLSDSVEDLEAVYEHINTKIRSINDVKNHKELVSLLNYIKYILDKMKYISEEHNKEIVSQYKNITHKMLKEEKTTYRRIRNK